MKLGLLIVWIPALTFQKDGYEIYRKQLAKAPQNKKLCLNIMDNLANKTQQTKALAYLGAYEMIKANHVFSPIQKLKTFNLGKKHLEEAIRAMPQDAELRYIRYAIQLSVPKFLGYNTNMNEDKKLMLDKHNTLSHSLQQDINVLLNL